MVHLLARPGLYSYWVTWHWRSAAGREAVQARTAWPMGRPTLRRRAPPSRTKPSTNSRWRSLSWDHAIVGHGGPALGVSNSTGSPASEATCRESLSSMSAPSPTSKESLESSTLSSRVSLSVAVPDKEFSKNVGYDERYVWEALH